MEEQKIKPIKVEPATNQAQSGVTAWLRDSRWAFDQNYYNKYFNNGKADRTRN